MSTNIEARKLSIIEYLADLQDEGIIQQIENLIKPKTDFWEELSPQQQQLIKKGIEDLDNNRRIEFQQFIQQFKK